MGSVTVVCMGSGDETLLTLASLQELKKARRLVLRTERHPVATYLRREGIPFETLDDLYEQAESFQELNCLGARRIAEYAQQEGMVYAVSDTMSDTVLAELKNRGEVQLSFLPGVSHAERCLSLLRESPSCVHICAAEAFSGTEYIPSVSLLLTELHSRECAGECKLKLLELMDEEAAISFLEGEESRGRLSVKTIPLYELDRQKRYDHLTAAFVPGLPWPKRKRYSIGDFVNVVERLRAPGGCPWDREQTHESLLRNLLEESYEYIQAVHEEDPEHMTEELGDVLLQIVLHSVIARQCGEFNFNDVTTAVCGKMIERHPHVFAKDDASSADEVLKKWEERKCAQRGILTYTEAMREVSTALPPLLRASKVQNKAHKIGFDFASPQEAHEKVFEEAKEVSQNLQDGTDPQEELGDLLFSVVNVCRLAKIDPDIALSRATDKFICRFSLLEDAVTADHKRLEDLTLDEMNVYWDKSKKRESGSAL